MSLDYASKNGKLWQEIEETEQPFEDKRGFEKLNKEIRKYGFPHEDREPQMICRLAFSVCPPRSACKQLVEECRWIENQDESWVCSHLGLVPPSPRGKVTTAIMRDLKARLDSLKGEDTCALFCVHGRSVQVKSVAPRSIVTNAVTANE
jgi:hypothetical protein